jgi:hypothetical protein
VYDADSESTVATTQANDDGRYCFVGAPSLATGHTYYVLYGPNSTDDRYVYLWFGPDITTYAAGTRQAGGDFAIADVRQLSPPHQATVTLPVTFRWQRRGLPGDTYRWAMSDTARRTEWWTGDLGDVGQVTVSALPQGAAFGEPYLWYIYAFQGQDSFGLSFYDYTVTFSPPSRAAWGPPLPVRHRDEMEPAIRKRNE